MGVGDRGRAGVGVGSVLRILLKLCTTNVLKDWYLKSKNNLRLSNGKIERNCERDNIIVGLIVHSKHLSVY